MFLQANFSTMMKLIYQMTLVQKKMIFKRGVKYPEWLMNYTKGNTSIMFSGTAEVKLLPVYVVYKSQHLWQSWAVGGPKGARFNRSKSG